MSSELLPCPFCGSTQIYVTHTRYYDNEDTVCVFCNACKQHVILEDNEAEGLNDKTREQAITAWNTRDESARHDKDVLIQIYAETIAELAELCRALYGKLESFDEYTGEVFGKRMDALGLLEGEQQ